MAHYFYTHIVDPSDIHRELDILDIEPHERNHLTLILESSLHHHIVDIILTELSDDHKKAFLMHMADDNHDGMWEIVEAGIDNPEQKIKECLDSFKNEIMKDIQAARLGELSDKEDEE